MLKQSTCKAGFLIGIEASSYKPVTYGELIQLLGKVKIGQLGTLAHAQVRIGTNVVHGETGPIIVEESYGIDHTEVFIGKTVEVTCVVLHTLVIVIVLACNETYIIFGSVHSMVVAPVLDFAGIASLSSF